MGGEVGRGDRRSGRPEAARLALPEVSLVEGIESLGGEGLERGRERRQADPLAGAPRPAARPEHREERRVGPESRLDRRRRPLDGVDEAVPGREAPACQLDGGSQDGVSGEPPVRSRAHRPTTGPLRAP